MRINILLAGFLVVLFALGGFEVSAGDGKVWLELIKEGQQIRRDTSIPEKERFNLAEKKYIQALDALESDPESILSHRKDVGQLFGEIDGLLWTQKRYEEAEPYLKRKLQLYSKYFGNDSMLTGSARQGLANLYKKLGRKEEALNEYKAVVNIYRANNKDEAVARVMANIKEIAGDDFIEIQEAKPDMLSLKQDKYNRFFPSEEVIKKAIKFGETADCSIDDFGNYDLGINKFDLANGGCYLQVRTPFVEVATRAIHAKKRKTKLAESEAITLLSNPSMIHIVLKGDKAQVEERVACVIGLGGASFDISDNPMSAHMCNDEGTKCTKQIMYILPDELAKENMEFTVMVKCFLGETKTKIDPNQMY